MFMMITLLSSLRVLTMLITFPFPTFIILADNIIFLIHFERNFNFVNLHILTLILLSRDDWTFRSQVFDLICLWD